MITQFEIGDLIKMKDLDDEWMGIILKKEWQSRASSCVYFIYFIEVEDRSWAFQSEIESAKGEHHGI